MNLKVKKYASLELNVPKEILARLSMRESFIKLKEVNKFASLEVNVKNKTLAHSTIKVIFIK